MTLIGQIVLLLSLPGSLLLLWAALLAGRRLRPTASEPAAAPAITILKPLYGAEPRLAANLETFLRQDYPGEVQIICGLHSADDPAVTSFRDLVVSHPEADFELVIDPRRHGANGKISNLINMMTRARHGVIVLSDSDMAVPPDYLRRIVAALEPPGVGAVSCLYRGRADAGIWSRLVAMGIDLHFLPAALIGLALRLGHPCMGSTIALRRETLEAIGGFAAFADILADDHAIGAAVRARGLAIAIPDMLLVHGCAERSLAALFRQELRWQATIAGIDPAGYAGSVLLHPFALALIGSALLGFSSWSLAVAGLALAARMIFALRLNDLRSLPLIPARDLLSFAVFFAAFFTRSVDWRGARLRMEEHGRLSAEETIAP